MWAKKSRFQTKTGLLSEIAFFRRSPFLSVPLATSKQLIGLSISATFCVNIFGKILGKSWENLGKILVKLPVGASKKRPTSFLVGAQCLRPEELWLKHKASQYRH
ncbi:hypothetical protein [Planktothricoides sp. SR001]|uniref:hypothetical protein n=1 Tax=Planktothricoides sp. SR001 TaxID=1705388 RepID=UPI0012E174C4|nr:hypothetical protein [Planktothricoides sp. SR001]